MGEIHEYNILVLCNDYIIKGIKRLSIVLSIIKRDI